MKKVVNGKFYNTQTAELLHSWSNNHSYSDFNYCEESLYKTKRGAYFIHGEGGAMTLYAKSCGSNSTCGSEDIKELSEIKAIEWLELHDGSDVLMEKFVDKIKEA